MTMPLPRKWAGNATFSGGAHAGEATKLDPGSAIAGNGFYPDLGFAAEHINHQLNAHALAARRAFLLAACKLRRVELEGTAITDTAESLAAVQRNVGTPLLALKTAQAFGMGDTDRFVVQGVPASITATVRDAATNGTRILATGAGGNRCTFSDDDGATWTAGGNATTEAKSIVWNATLGLFLAVRALDVARSTNGVAWSSSTGDIVVGTLGPSALAVLSNGNTFGIGSGSTHYVKSTDGIAFAATAGGPPGTGVDLDEGPSLAGNAGSVFYIAGRHSSGARIEVASSSDGITNTALATLTPQASATFASRPRLLMCQNTGLLILAAPTSGNQCALYASLDGADWVGPHVLFPDPGVQAFGLAGGRLLYTQDDMLFASDGVGY